MTTINIDHAKCKRDHFCRKVCPSFLFKNDPENFPTVAPEKTKNCIKCGHCVAICPHDAIDHSDIPLTASPLANPDLKVSPESLDQLQRMRRSIRQYKSQPVLEETIKAIVETARWAPSAVNYQPVQWIILKDRPSVKHIAGIVVDGLRQMKNQPAHMAFFIESWDKGHDVILRGAPHVAVAYATNQWAWGSVDCTIAMTYFDLAAASHGVGTCWAGILMHAAASYPALEEALGVPKGSKIGAAMMFGYPELTFRRIPARKPAKIIWK